MAAVKVKNKSLTVTIDRKWQVAFIAALVGSQAISIGLIIWSMTRYSHYTSAATWVFQIAQWFYPILFVVAGYIFSLRRVRGTVPRLFWAMFVATIGVAVYGSTQWLFNIVMSHFNLWPVIGPNDRSWWSAYGITWVEMGAVFALYCLALWLIYREGKRR